MILHNKYNVNLDNKKTAEMVIGLMAVFNEEDILQQTLSYYTEIGINILIIDNGSTDNSLNIAKSARLDSRYCLLTGSSISILPSEFFCKNPLPIILKTATFDIPLSDFPICSIVTIFKLTSLTITRAKQAKV